MNQSETSVTTIDDTFARITLTCAENHEYFIGTKFRKHSPKGSMEKAEYIFFDVFAFYNMYEYMFSETDDEVSKDRLEKNLKESAWKWPKCTETSMHWRQKTIFNTACNFECMREKKFRTLIS